MWKRIQKNQIWHTCVDQKERKVEYAKQKQIEGVLNYSVYSPVIISMNSIIFKVSNCELITSIYYRLLITLVI